MGIFLCFAMHVEVAATTTIPLIEERKKNY